MAQAEAAIEERSAVQAPLWTRGFLFLCLTTILCYICHQLVVVTLPLYVQGLGGSPVLAGLVFTSFSVISFILRPLLGHLTDRWSAKGTLMGGAAILAVFGTMFTIPSLVVAFIANTFRGIGWGAYSTASSVGVAYVVPPSRRGEGSGYFGTSTTIATAFAPAFGLWLLSSTGQYSVVFIVSGIAGIAAMLAVAMMPNYGTGTTTFGGALRLARDEFTLSTFIDRHVLMASMLLLCITMSGPVTFAFVPVHALAIGVDNIGLYFILSGLTAIVARMVLGRLMDRQSRGFWFILGSCILLVGFLVFTMASSIEMFLLAGFFNSFGHAITQPSLMAFAMDRAEKGRMGRAMATYSMAWRVGEGLGAPVAGTLIVLFGYTGMYVGAIVYTLAGIILAAVNWGSVGKPTGRAMAD